jgi:hypothetical protein
MSFKDVFVNQKVDHLANLKVDHPGVKNGHPRVFVIDWLGIKLTGSILQMTEINNFLCFQTQPIRDNVPSEKYRHMVSHHHDGGIPIVRKFKSTPAPGLA